LTRETLSLLDDRFTFQTSGRFDLLIDEHVPYPQLGAADVDGALRKAIERAEGVIAVVGRVGSGKSSLIAAVADGLDEGFVPLRVSVIGIEAGDPVAFIRHAITEIRDLPQIHLTQHEERALDRAAAEHRTTGRAHQLRAGGELGAGHILTAKVIGEIQTAASEELQRATDPAEAMSGMQRLLDTFWKIMRCPVLIVEDTDHWSNAPETADRFFDQTARAFVNLDGVMVIATQSDYAKLDGYRRVRERLTAEVSLPKLPNAVAGLATVLEHRMLSSEVDGPLDEILEPPGLELLAQSYLASTHEEAAGDLRHTLAVMRTAIDVALAKVC